MTEFIGLLIAQSTVFALLWLIGLPAGLLHPRARFGEHAKALAVFLAPVLALAFVAAVIGVGAVSWLLWGSSFVLMLTLDINAAVKRQRRRKVLHRFDRGQL